MRLLVRAFIAATATMTAIGGAPAVVDGVVITSRDGVQLKRTYFSPGQPGPGIVLFHQCDGHGRGSWGTWPRDLAAAGFHVLTFDNRGVGDSQRAMKNYDGSTHGVALFRKDGELGPTIVKWLQGVMK